MCGAFAYKQIQTNFIWRQLDHAEYRRTLCLYRYAWQTACRLWLNVPKTDTHYTTLFLLRKQIDCLLRILPSMWRKGHPGKVAVQGRLPIA